MFGNVTRVLRRIDSPGAGICRSMFDFVGYVESHTRHYVFATSVPASGCSSEKKVLRGLAHDNDLSSNQHPEPFRFLRLSGHLNFSLEL